MKQCPQCQKTYPDDISFCLEDGSTLSFSNFSTYNDAPTVMVPNFQTNPQLPANQTAKWVYPVVGVMSGLIIVLVFLAVFPYLKSENGNTKEPNKNEKVTVEAPPPSPQTVIVEVPVLSSAGRFPEGSTRFLTNDDLYGKSSWDLRIMRNEIFARHGYIFRKPELRQYFLSQAWYTPRSADVSGLLSNVEKQNVQFLKKHE